MADWTTKDYQMVADIIKAAAEATLPSDNNPAGQYDPEEMRVHIAEQFAYRFTKDNPRFKSHLFYRACGTFPEAKR